MCISVACRTALPKQPPAVPWAILWAASAEGKIHRWFSTNYNVEVHAYVKNGKYCVVNNTYEPQQTTVYRGDGSSFAVDLAANAILWYEI